MPLWCVVQRADYGYITSYGPKLLEILSQPGFSEALGHEGKSFCGHSKLVGYLLHSSSSANSKLWHYACSVLLTARS